MGSGFSTAASVESRVSAMPGAKNNRVVAFHSTERWKAYFQASVDSNKLIVIAFTATWCHPCKFMEPALNDFAAKYGDVDFVKIDVDELLEVAKEFGIQTMPTFLFIKNGKTIDKLVGAKKEELQWKIEMHIM